MTGTHIVVVNPNSTVAVTNGISAALDPLRVPGGPVIECLTLASGPPAVETDEHVAAVVEPLCELMADAGDRAGAFVIACYSDPGLERARSLLHAPVFGIAQCGLAIALTRGRAIGVVSLFEESVVRHRAGVEQMGLAAAVAADVPLDLGVLDLADRDVAWGRLVEVGRELRDDHGADVVVLGCTGLAPYRAGLEDELGIAVVDPTQAAVTVALGAVLL